MKKGVARSRLPKGEAPTLRATGASGELGRDGNGLNVIQFITTERCGLLLECNRAKPKKASGGRVESDTYPPTWVSWEFPPQMVAVYDLGA